MSIDAYEQMPTGVSDITSNALVTLKLIYNALLVNELGLWLPVGNSWAILRLVKTG